MKTRQIILAALWLNCLAVNETAISSDGRDKACFGDATTYLLAANSGALIRVESESGKDPNSNVIVFRPQKTHGWASQRLLMRFDLKLDDQGRRIVNSGEFCKEGR